VKNQKKCNIRDPGKKRPRLTKETKDLRREDNGDKDGGPYPENVRKGERSSLPIRKKNRDFAGHVGDEAGRP